MEAAACQVQYARASAAADAYLKLADAHHAGTWTRPVVYYLGGCAKFSIGDEAGALQLLERLEAEYPDYKRYHYYSGNVAPDPNESIPTAFGVTKLIAYLKIKRALKQRSNAFVALKQVTAAILTALSAKNAYIALLVSRGTKYNPYYPFQFDESRFGSQPDQWRAGALPSTMQLVQQAWGKLLPAAVKADAKGVRAWLRGLSTPDALLSQIALDRLQGIDDLIIKQYFAEAQRLMSLHNYDGVRSVLHAIQKEYPNSEAAQRAADELPKIVPVAVNFYKQEGDKYYQPVNHIGVPQTKSREFYSKMLAEEPEGVQADYAMLQLAQALGTEGKVSQAIQILMALLQKFPTSKHRASATYLIGFFYGSMSLKKYEESIQWMQKVIKEFPGSPEAPESLWHIAFFLGGQKHQAEAISYLEQLKKNYPNSFRHKWVDEEIANLRSQS